MKREGKENLLRGAMVSVFVLILCATLALQAASAGTQPVSDTRSAALLAADAPTSGTAGADVRWVLDSTGVLVIRGSGRMTNYVGVGRAPWYARKEQITRLRIENGVTELGNYAFAGLTQLREAELGDGVTLVGSSAFSDCPALDRLTFGASVRELGTGAFSNCDSLWELNLPDALEIVGQSAFFGCDALEEVELPGGVKELKPYAFSACSRLWSVQLPAALRTIGTRAFANCAVLSELAIAGHVSALGAGAFSGCTALRRVELPPALDEIPGRAFADSGLEAVRIPDGVSEIGAEAFSGCTALEYAVIGRSVTKVEEGAFQNCTGLQAVYYPGTKKQWTGVSMDDFRRQLAWQGVELHYRSTGPEDVPDDAGIRLDSILPDTDRGTVQVEVSGSPGEDVVLIAAVYAPDGQLLCVELRDLEEGGIYTFRLPTEDAGSAAAFLLNRQCRPVAGEVRCAVSA